MKKMNKRNKGNILVKGLVNASVAIVLGTVLLSSATGEGAKVHKIEAEITTSINRASMFLSKGDTYSAKLIVKEDILNKYEEIPESILPGVENLCETLNIK